MAGLVQANAGCLPSELVDESDAALDAEKAPSHLWCRGIDRFCIRHYGAADYPLPFRDATDPIEFLYFFGLKKQAEAPRRIAVVGTRNPSSDGAAHTRKLVQYFVKSDFTIVSEIAAGVDIVAHQIAIERDDQTVAVMGASVLETYSQENAALRRCAAEELLLISEVPVPRNQEYVAQINRQFFPIRKKTTSTLSEGTIIVEASETSETRIQARAALQHGRRLFILGSNFHNPVSGWPTRYGKPGAIG